VGGERAEAMLLEHRVPMHQGGQHAEVAKDGADVDRLLAPLGPRHEALAALQQRERVHLVRLGARHHAAPVQPLQGRQ
jgi:hypothetical protein